MALIPNLVRHTEGRMLAGVCAGIAQYLKVDVTLVRVVVAAAVLVGGVSLWIYPLAWLLMPEQGSDKAGIDTLVQQTKEWGAKANQQWDRPQGGEPREVFNPYQEPRN